MFLCCSSILGDLGIPIFWEIGGWGVDNLVVLAELCVHPHTAANRPVYGDCGIAWVMRNAGFWLSVGCGKAVVRHNKRNTDLKKYIFVSKNTFFKFPSR
jgi:hypothetical protein